MVLAMAAGLVRSDGGVGVDESVAGERVAEAGSGIGQAGSAHFFVDFHVQPVGISRNEKAKVAREDRRHASRWQASKVGL